MKLNLTPIELRSFFAPGTCNRPFNQFSMDWALLTRTEYRWGGTGVFVSIYYNVAM